MSKTWERIKDFFEKVAEWTSEHISFRLACVICIILFVIFVVIPIIVILNYVYFHQRTKAECYYLNGPYLLNTTIWKGDCSEDHDNCTVKFDIITNYVGQIFPSVKIYTYASYQDNGKEKCVKVDINYPNTDFKSLNDIKNWVNKVEALENTDRHIECRVNFENYDKTTKTYFAVVETYSKTTLIIWCIILVIEIISLLTYLCYLFVKEVKDTSCGTATKECVDGCCDCIGGCLVICCVSNSKSNRDPHDSKSIY
jgi:hypothetical protein